MRGIKKIRKEIELDSIIKLKEEIDEIRALIRDGKLNKAKLQNIIEESRSFWKYDFDKFPKLGNTRGINNSVGDVPQNLAEALLWKMGKWKTFKDFASYYKNDDAISKGTDVVFFAFAKHLENQDKYPIFDQHSLRAVWTVADDLSLDEENQIRRFLFDGANNWKRNGYGVTADECYLIFCEKIKSICERNGIGFGELDKLMMPLGQEIKVRIRSFEEFQELLGK